MKKYGPIIALLLVIGLMGFQTLAYFTTQTKTTNVITTASIDIELYNMMLDANGEEVALDTEIDGIIPGDTESQRPYVTNTGEVPLYARVHLSSNIIDRNGEEMLNILEFNIDTENWIADKANDGWYYYKDIIQPGEKVKSPLFTEVHFPIDTMGNEHVGSTSTISVKAQAVQSEHNEHENVLDVQGWPLAEGGAK